MFGFQRGRPDVDLTHSLFSLLRSLLYLLPAPTGTPNAITGPELGSVRERSHGDPPLIPEQTFYPHSPITGAEEQEQLFPPHVLPGTDPVLHHLPVTAAWERRSRLSFVAFIEILWGVQRNL